MKELTLEDIEFLKILSNSDSSIIQNMKPELRHEFDSRVGKILREYYLENTLGLEPIWTKKFEKAGITKDDGKSAIACARRLGIDIS